ncbi:MAG: hypothetical protein OEZ39_01370 [Gammaproteobacteria bacterium]|nr:hypothetical protein [Gammaproteobacteria bacterium]MDH5650502.1 hypothetical protein [Gammaproteobacteria bacterium]
MKILGYVGIAFVLFGVADFIGSYAGFDLWGMTGIVLPEAIWKYSAYIEMAIGYGLYKLAENAQAEEEPQTA